MIGIIKHSKSTMLDNVIKKYGFEDLHTILFAQALESWENAHAAGYTASAAYIAQSVYNMYDNYMRH